MKFQIKFNIIILLILAVAGIGSLYGTIRDSLASSEYTVYPLEKNYSYYFSGYNNDYYMINEKTGKGPAGSYNSYAIPKNECSIPFNESVMHALDIVRIKIYSDDEITMKDEVVQVQHTNCIRIYNAKKIVIDMNSVLDLVLILFVLLLAAGNLIIGFVRFITHLFTKKKE